MTRFLLVGTLTLLLTAPIALAAESPVGKWKTVDEKSGKVVSEVELYDEGGKLYGKIVGLVIIKGLSPDKDRYKGGTILDPDDGKVYKAEVWEEGGKLKVRGYLGV